MCDAPIEDDAVCVTAGVFTVNTYSIKDPGEHEWKSGSASGYLSLSVSVTTSNTHRHRSKSQ